MVCTHKYPSQKGISCAHHIFSPLPKITGCLIYLYSFSLAVTVDSSWCSTGSTNSHGVLVSSLLNMLPSPVLHAQTSFWQKARWLESGARCENICKQLMGMHPSAGLCNQADSWFVTWEPFSKTWGSRSYRFLPFLTRTARGSLAFYSRR